MAKSSSSSKSTVDLVNEAIDNAEMSDTVQETAAEMSDKIQAYTEKLSSEVERYVSEGIDAFQKIANEYSEKLSRSAAQASEQAKKAYDEGQTYVRANPTPTILGAFAIGILLGAIIRRG